MLQFSLYALTSLLSTVIILVMGICLLLVSVLKEPQLRNYRVARRFLGGAYIILSAVGLWEVFGEIDSDGEALVRAFTVIAASFQSMLFTFSIITLINIQYMTALRVWSNLIPISLASGILLAVLFAAPEHFYTVFYMALTLYCLQLAYYILLFTKEYRRYKYKFDNLFSDNEYRRALWIRRSFYMAAGIGVAAIASLFVSTQVYINFMAAYTIFYIYFAVKFISYVSIFHRIAPVVAAPCNETANGKEIPAQYVHTAVGQWVGNKGFLSQDISLESLAQELNTNPSYLSRYINKEYGQNFRSWINSLRIAEAQRLIAGNTGLSLAEIGENVGIPSSSTFYRQFAAVTGMTPAEYYKAFGGCAKTK